MTQLAVLDPAASSAHQSVTLHALVSIARFVSAPPRSSLWRRFAPALTLFVLRLRISLAAPFLLRAGSAVLKDKSRGELALATALVGFA